MSQAIQILGAVAILAAYALAQLRVLDQRSYPYNVLNLLGAVALGVIAYVERLWGFFLLESPGASSPRGGWPSAYEPRLKPTEARG